VMLPPPASTNRMPIRRAPAPTPGAPRR
jgi:hypothetical protein